MAAAPTNENQSRPRREGLTGQLARPLRAFVETEVGGATLLLSAAVLALLCANSFLSDAYESLWETEIVIRVGDYVLSMDLLHWINDGLMAVFFFVVGLELRRELSVGELRKRRRAVLPVAGAIGGLVVPALLYLLVNPSGDEADGWGITIGTDTAFLLGALALVGPKFSTQLRVVLLMMTIVDDVLAIAIIGLVYSESLDVGAMLVAAVCLGLIMLLGQLSVWRAWMYGLVVLALWVATVESGLHPTIAGLAAGLLIGARPPRRDEIERLARLGRAFIQSPMPSAGYKVQRGLERAVSVNERLQEALHPWTSYLIVPLFAFANAGVDLRGGLLSDALESPVTWGVVLGLVIGKPVGIGLAALLVVKLRLGAMPRGVGPGQLLGGAALSGMGFTVSILIGSLAFDSTRLQEEATVGVLIAALASVATGWAAFRLAAVFLGERTATLPMVLAQPVDPTADHIRGSADAPLTLLEYADFECSFCAAATTVSNDLRQRFGDNLRYVFRHLPLSDIHPHAELAAQAAEAAGAQGRFWEMHDLLFQHQDQLEAEDLIGYAAKLDLDVEEFARSLNEGRFAEHVEEDVAGAEASGARRTPTFFIGNQRHIGPHDAETLAAALEASRSAAVELNVPEPAGG